jgi:hypothetical protein
MGFDDAARRMRGERGGGEVPSTIDPDQIIAEAVRAEQRSSRRKDLLLGAILMAGGGLVGVLWYDTMARVLAGWFGDARPAPEGKMMPGPLMYLIGLFAIGAIIVGTLKMLRGLGVLRR